MLVIGLGSVLHGSLLSDPWHLGKVEPVEMAALYRLSCISVSALIPWARCVPHSFYPHSFTLRLCSPFCLLYPPAPQILIEGAFIIISFVTTVSDNGISLQGGRVKDAIRTTLTEGVLSHQEATWTQLA